MSDIDLNLIFELIFDILKDFLTDSSILLCLALIILLSIIDILFKIYTDEKFNIKERRTKDE